MVLATLSLTVATPVAVWWLIGDQTEIPADLDPHYILRPIEVAPAVEDAVGVTCLVTVGAALLLVTWKTLRHRAQRPWWSVVLPVLVAGYIVGVCWRAATTGVVDANIGAGVWILLGIPSVTTLLLWAVVRGIELVRFGGPTGRGEQVDDQPAWPGSAIR
jgi:hypothetical protein